MKTTLAQSEICLSPELSDPSRNAGAPAWEYCFLLQDSCNPQGSELVQLNAAGWSVVSFRTRFDSQCEYLLKRARK